MEASDGRGPQGRHEVSGVTGGGAEELLSNRRCSKARKAADEARSKSGCAASVGYSLGTAMLMRLLADWNSLTRRSSSSLLT